MSLQLAPRLIAALLGAGLLVPVAHIVIGASVDPQQLGGPERYLTFISTDKPVYRTGERVYVRGVVLESHRRTPLPRGQESQVTIEVRGPKGDVVAGGYAQSQDSVWSFGWTIPAEQAGGEYSVHATYPQSGHAPAERKFDIRAYRAPRLKSQIVFLRDGYGPGDKVTATLDVKRAEGGVPAGARVTATALVDGQEVARVPSKVDEQGLCTVSFDLPKELARGEGSLAFAIEDGGVVETAAKTIPILLQTVDLALYPEGGELVAGLPARVYFEARTPAKKPADIAGEVVEQRTGKAVARFRSEHEGRGRFELTPQPGARYVLRIAEPTGIRATFPLPQARESGAALRSEQEVVPRGQPVRLSVSLAGLQRAKVTLSQREQQVASAEVQQSGTVVLDPKEAEGVLIATVWDGNGRPLAERLLFRAPAQPLSVEVRADKTSYVPGGQVKLTVKTTRNGRPVPAVVGLTVTDDSVLEMIEKREQAPQLPAMVLLEPEVQELADAHVYLDEKNPKAPVAVDLLLGTQGWRRFAFVNPTQFIAQHGDQARRVLALRIAVRPPMDDFAAIGALGGGVPAGMRGGPPRAVPRPTMAIPKAAARAEVDEGLPQAAPAPAPPPVAAGAPVPPMRDMLADEDRPAMKEAIDQAEQRAAKRRIAPSKPRPPVRQDLVAIREYAHSLRPGRRPTDRVDFTETLYWNAAVRTREGTGEASVSFALNDSVTSFKALASAFDSAGALGAGSASLESVQPFYLEPKVPLEVTRGDTVLLPLALVNGTSSALKGASVQVQVGNGVSASAVAPLELPATARVRRMLELKIGPEGQSTDLQLAARAGDYADTVTRKLSVKPNGFPAQVAFGGLVGPALPAVHTLTLPADMVRGSLRARIAVYPTPLANMTESLERLIQEPSGCFEQTSSTTYPMTMAQQYFLSHTGVDPKLVEAAREKLERGYQRLVGFECKEKGYEWFGQDPGHEALTAYGLLHFTDMRQVREVDGAMLERTRAWLLAQRDGKGGFNRKRRALHVWVEDPDTSNAYILWSLLESGEKNVSREVAALKEAAAKSQNSYVLALAANVLSLAGDKAEARRLMARLAEKQDKAGVVQGGTQSIVGSGGEALAIETTSLAVLAWLRDPEYAGNVERAMKYLADSCKGGRYGSTQSTVLALRAIVAYDKARARPKAPGSVRVYVDGRPVGSPVQFNSKSQGAITLPDVSELLTAGTRKLELRMEGGSEMPYAMAVDYYALTPVSSRESPVTLEVSLNQPRATEGELLEARAVVRNETGQSLPTAVAIVGLPGGLEPRHDQLKELVKKGAVDAYEVLGREVVLYWRGMQPRQVREVPLSLVAAVPGTYTGPASRAYLYYTDEHKTWVEGLKVSIAPKG